MNPLEMVEVHTYTDDKAGRILEKLPICFDEVGNITADPIRQPTYTGETVLHTNVGPQTIGFPIQAKSLFEAIQLFGQCVAGVIEEIESRQIQNRIMEAGKKPIPSGLVLDKKKVKV
jgi:hypothetical protein